MQRCWRFLLVGYLAVLPEYEAQIMSVDLGHEFFKVALMRQGAPLEIVLNGHSKRKTTTATSFFESVRVFGDDALAHQGKAPAKVPMFAHSLLGHNFTEVDVAPGGAWWEAFGLGDRFYRFDLGYDVARGVPTYTVGVGENKTLTGETVLANILYFAQKMAEASSDGKPVRDVVVTVPPDANLRHRQAIWAAARIAGLRPLTLVHEGAAFAVQRAVDFTIDKDKKETALIYNLGSRKVEVTIVQYESRQAGMVAGKTAPVVTVLGSALDFGVGGHLMDVKIADAMLKRFQEKHPALAAGIAENPRALRKLLTQAQKTKAILSANKQAPFIVESLFEDTDFQATISRDEFEKMVEDQLARLTAPIEAALQSANKTMKDVHHVEVVGGAWRVPKVQQVLSEFIEASAGRKLALGQHLNGEESAALGAALVGANSSSSFRVKKIFFTDVTTHSYAVQVTSLNGAWERNLTMLYPAGSPLGGKQKVHFTLEDDFAVNLFEDGVLMSTYQMTGLAEVLAGKWSEYNRTGPPKIKMSVNLDGSGIVEVKNPLATVEEVYWVNVTKEKPRKGANATGNATGNATANATKPDAEDAEGATATAEGADEEAAESEGETADTTGANATGANATGGNATGGNATGGNASEVEYEVKTIQKKKKHEKKLAMTRIDFAPRPVAEEDIEMAKAHMAEMAAKEEEVTSMNAIKNELEGAIFESRDKIDGEEITKVSTEEQREEVRKLCTEYEEWIYEGGTSKSEYEQKITALQALLGPMEERAQELEARSELTDSVKADLEDIHKTHTNIEKSMPWVDKNKTAKAVTQTEEFEEWWKKKLESQAQLPLHEAPAFTKKEVVEKLGQVQKAWDKLKKTKKPKEKTAKNASNASTDKKADAKKKAGASAAAGAEGGGGAAEAPLPTDAAAAKAELEKVRQLKAKAVEEEDFDAADRYKQRERRLKVHLDQIDEKREL